MKKIFLTLFLIITIFLTCCPIMMVNREDVINVDGIYFNVPIYYDNVKITNIESTNKEFIITYELDEYEYVVSGDKELLEYLVCEIKYNEYDCYHPINKIFGMIQELILLNS